MVALIALFINGCATEEEEAGPEIVVITPADGAENVGKTTAIKVEFNEAMHMSSCESRFGLFAGNLDSIPTDILSRFNADGFDNVYNLSDGRNGYGGS